MKSLIYLSGNYLRQEGSGSETEMTLNPFSFEALLASAVAAADMSAVAVMSATVLVASFCCFLLTPHARLVEQSMLKKWLSILFSCPI